jgi:hypothetical protein
MHVKISLKFIPDGFKTGDPPVGLLPVVVYFVVLMPAS